MPMLRTLNPGAKMEILCFLCSWQFTWRRSFLVMLPVGKRSPRITLTSFLMLFLDFFFSLFRIHLYLRFLIPGVADLTHQTLAWEVPSWRGTACGVGWAPARGWSSLGLLIGPSSQCWQLPGCTTGQRWWGRVPRPVCRRPGLPSACSSSKAVPPYLEKSN